MNSVSIFSPRVLLSCALALLLGAPARAPAQTLPNRPEHIVGPYEDLFGYGTRHHPDGTQTNTFYAIDTDHGIVRDIGPTAFPFPFDSAYDPDHYVRYSLMPLIRDGLTISAILCSTSEITGQTTQIGETGPPLALTYAPLAYQRSTGILYALANETTSTGLYQLDLNNGHAQSVFAFTNGNHSGPVCWAPDGHTLYMAENSYRAIFGFDLNGGANQPIGFADFSSYGVPSLAVDASGQFLYAIAYDDGSGPPAKHPIALLVYSIPHWKLFWSIPLTGDISPEGGKGPTQLFFASPLEEHR